MNRSSIPYLTHVWNPTTGCRPVSAGCASCWAAAYHRRWRKDFAPTTHPEKLDEPLRLRKPAVIGVSFMGDLFHDDVPDSFIYEVLAIIAHCSVEWFRCFGRDCDHECCDENHLLRMDPQTFVMLTKRPERARSILSDPDLEEAIEEGWDCGGWHFEDPPYRRAVWPLHNLWLGVSVENQATADARIPLLLETPAAHRWVSLEPQIGQVVFDQHWFHADWPRHTLPTVGPDGLDPSIDWVVQGCESGPNRRFFASTWARTVREQCATASVPYYLKQMPDRVSPSVIVAKPRLDGLQHLELPWEKKP